MRSDSLLAHLSSTGHFKPRHGRWLTPTGTRLAAAILGFFAVLLIPVALSSAVEHHAPSRDTKFACTATDGRATRVAGGAASRVYCAPDRADAALIARSPERR